MTELWPERLLSLPRGKPGEEAVGKTIGVEREPGELIQSIRVISFVSSIQGGTARVCGASQCRRLGKFTLINYAARYNPLFRGFSVHHSLMPGISENL